MKSSKPIPDYFDQRRGMWTTFTIAPERIVFSRGKPKQHWFLLMLSLVIAGLLIISLLNTLVGLITLTVLAAVAIWLFSMQRAIDKKRFPIVLTKNAATDKPRFTTGVIYESALIQKFIVRENTGRDRAEDSHLIQIYMSLKSSDKLVLLHQDYHTRGRIDKIQQIAESFTCWLGVSGG